METTRLNVSACPFCGHVMDCASTTDGKSGKPKPEDVSVCISCFEILVFDKNLLMQKPTAEFMEELEPEFKLHLSDMQEQGRKLNKYRKSNPFNYASDTPNDLPENY